MDSARDGWVEAGAKKVWDRQNAQRLTSDMYLKTLFFHFHKNG